MSAPRPSSNPLQNLRNAVGERPAAEVLDEIVRAIRGARTFVAAAHVNPDGDALGSLAAMGHILRALGKEARVVIGEEVPEKYRPFFSAGLPEVLDKQGAARIAKPEVFILLDTAVPERAGIFKDLLLAPGVRRLCIDHHLPGSVRHHDLELAVPEAPSTGNLVLALADALDVVVDAPMARALWIAVATDTGWFRHSNTTRWALEDAARLVEHGIDTEGLHETLYESLTLARSRLLGAVLSEAREELGGDLLWSAVSREQLLRHGLGPPDLEGFIDYLKSIRGPRHVAFIAEIEPGRYKVSLRARGDADVERIARKFGGGGHAKAAGYRASGRLEDIVALLREAVSGPYNHIC